MATVLCKAGRSFDSAHPTCRSCERLGAMVCSGSLQKKASKHGNVKVEVDGIVFDSKREAARYMHLMMLQRVGVISGLRLQVPFVLQPAVLLDGKKKRELKYLADFVYLQDGREIVEDSKSPHLRKHPVFRLKKHLMQSVLGLAITEV
jgi:hypothetical protein